MQLRSFIIIFIFLPLSSMADVDRFEELFIWKMSEAMKLDAKKESEFSQIIRKINQKKGRALQSLNKSAEDLSKQKSEGDSKQAVESYKKSLNSYQSINEEEIVELKKIFNYKELAMYLSYKNEVLKKLHDRLTKQAKDGRKDKKAKSKVIIED